MIDISKGAKKEIKDKVNKYLNGLQEIGLELVSLHLKSQNETQFVVKLGPEDEPCQSNYDDLILSTPSFEIWSIKWVLP